MLIIKKYNLKIVLWKKIFKINKNYLKNFKIVLEIKNIFKKKNLIIFNALNSSQHSLGIYKNNIKNKGWFNEIISNFKNFKIINLNEINSNYGSSNFLSKNVIKYKKNIFFKINFKDSIKILKNILKKIKIKKIYVSIGCSQGGIKNFIFYTIYFKKIKFLINIGSSIISKKNKIKNINDKKLLKLEKNEKYKFYNLKNINNLKFIRKINILEYITKNQINKKNKSLFKKKYKLKIYKKNIFKYLEYKSNKFIKYFNIKNYIYNIKFNNNFIYKKKIFKNKKKIILIYFINDSKFNLKSFISLIKKLISFKKKINLKILRSDKGHDSFLINTKEYSDFLKILKIKNKN